MMYRLLHHRVRATRAIDLQYLTDKHTLGDTFGAAQLAIHSIAGSTWQHLEQNES